MGPNDPLIGSFGEILDRCLDPERRLLLVVGCVLGCLVGLPGCSGDSATPTQRARQARTQRRAPRPNHAGSVEQACPPAHCRRFAVSGGASIQDSTADPGSDQAQSDPSGRSCAPTQQRRAVQEGQDVAEAAAVLGAPDGAALMRHFLSGRDTPVTFGPSSHMAKLIARNASFQSTTRSVTAELKQQLVPLTASHRGTAPMHLALDRTFWPSVPTSTTSREIPISICDCGEHRVCWLHGTGRAYLSAQPDQTGHASGSLTYTISDVYGFSSQTQFRILGHAVGPDLHYLQTTCGAPAHHNGAHWFRDAVRVITHSDSRSPRDSGPSAAHHVSAQVDTQVGSFRPIVHPGERQGGLRGP